jgi:hypothetical protein
VSMLGMEDGLPDAHPHAARVALPPGGVRSQPAFWPSTDFMRDATPCAMSSSTRRVKIARCSPGVLAPPSHCTTSSCR